MEFKKVLVTIAIAVLFTLFVITLVHALYKNPKYEDFCNNPYSYPLKIAPEDQCPNISFPQNETAQCTAQRGYLEARYDADGCVSSYECNTCQNLYENARAEFFLYIFIYAAIFGIAGIIFGLYYKGSDWLSSGFLFGGLITLFTGTIIYFSELNRLAKPIVMVIELAIVIFVALKKFGDNGTAKNVERMKKGK
ncbi:hypothetical protein C4573_04495 [Candidatus Woesearchaeota archaeon]|nr:MAG: hypothetical protein C4573_04495 [Candidatus Woesearchaeota archaeon]